MKKDLPNWLTYSRIAVIPLLIVAYYLPWRWSDWLAAGLFLYAGITDFFDGYLARAWQAQSSLGKFLDPIADKLLIATALLLLVGDQRADILPAIAILCREILVSGLREFLAELRISVPVTRLAKYKTAIQMIAIFLLLLGKSGPAFFPTLMVGDVLLWAAAILTLFTGYIYLKTGIKYFR